MPDEQNVQPWWQVFMPAVRTISDALGVKQRPIALDQKPQDTTDEDRFFDGSH